MLQKTRLRRHECNTLKRLSSLDSDEHNIDFERQFAR